MEVSDVAPDGSAPDAMATMVDERIVSLSRLTAEAYQYREELVATAQLLGADPPGVVLEIGTGCGGWLWVMRPVMAPVVDILTIDPDTCGRITNSERVFAALRDDDTKVRCLRLFSENPTVPVMVRHWLAGRAVDVLMIDGDHEYKAVRHDWETYSPMVRPGGLVLFHDINPGPGHPLAPVDGAPRFWREEMATRLGALSIVSRDVGEGLGIGVIRMEG